MDYGIAGKSALVTGGSRGIGRAIGMALAREGVNVALCARRREPLEETAREIREATGVRVIALPADMALPEEIARCVANAAEGLGGLDILVNNASNYRSGPIGALTDEDWTHHFNVKVFGYLRCLREAVPHMQRAGWGRIVNIAGNAARQAAAVGSTAGATNAAIVNITKSMSDAFARDGITANVVHPGATDTERYREILDLRVQTAGISREQAVAETVSTIPIGRMIRPEDVAAITVFLASRQAGAITGQAISVDGGSARGIFY